MIVFRLPDWKIVEKVTMLNFYLQLHLNKYLRKNQTIKRNRQGAFKRFNVTTAQVRITNCNKYDCLVLQNKNKQTWMSCNKNCRRDSNIACIVCFRNVSILRVIKKLTGFIYKEIVIYSFQLHKVPTCTTGLDCIASALEMFQVL